VLKNWLKKRHNHSKKHLKELNSIRCHRYYVKCKEKRLKIQQQKNLEKILNSVIQEKKEIISQI